MQIIRETENYQLIKDGLMGVTRFVRKRDGALTYWNCGHSAEQEIKSVAMMNDAVFDEYADDNEYHE